MEYIKFGTTDLSVSPMGLGCLRMSEQGGVVDDVESIATLHMAFDLGINFLDTSANYGQGHNHRLIASALKGRQEKVIVHTKSGSPRTPDSSGSRSGSSPEYLTRVCEESLQRLELETLDIFCMSRVDPDIPIEGSIGAMAAWWSMARPGISPCLKQAPIPSNGPTKSIPSYLFRWNTPFGPGTLRAETSRPAGTTTWVSWPIPPWAGGFLQGSSAPLLSWMRGTPD